MKAEEINKSPNFFHKQHHKKWKLNMLWDIGTCILHKCYKHPTQFKNDFS